MRDASYRARKASKTHGPGIGIQREGSTLTIQKDAFAMWKRLGLRTRTANTLIANNILTMDQLKAVPFRKLCFIENLGPTGLISIQRILNPSQRVDIRLDLLSASQIYCVEEWINKIGERRFSDLIDQLCRIVEENFEPARRPHAIYTFGAIVRQKVHTNQKVRSK